MKLKSFSQLSWPLQFYLLHINLIFFSGFFGAEPWVCLGVWSGVGLRKTLFLYCWLWDCGSLAFLFAQCCEVKSEQSKAGPACYSSCSCYVLLLGKERKISRRLVCLIKAKQFSSIWLDPINELSCISLNLTGLIVYNKLARVPGIAQ